MDTDSDVTMCSDVENEIDIIPDSMTPRMYSNRRPENDKSFEFEIRKTNIELEDPKKCEPTWGRYRLRPRNNSTCSLWRYSDVCLSNPTPNRRRQKPRKRLMRKRSSSISDISKKLSVVALNNYSKGDARYKTETRGRPRKNPNFNLSDILSSNLVLDSSKQNTCCRVDLTEHNYSKLVAIEAFGSHDKTVKEDQQMEYSDIIVTPQVFTLERWETSEQFLQNTQCPEQASNIQDQSDSPKFDNNPSVSSKVTITDMPKSLLSGSCFCLTPENESETNTKENSTQHRYPLRSQYCSQTQVDYFGHVSLLQKDEVSPTIEGCSTVKRQLKEHGVLSKKRRTSSQKKKLKHPSQENVKIAHKQKLKTLQDAEAETFQELEEIMQGAEMKNTQEVELEILKEVELDIPEKVVLEDILNITEEVEIRQKAVEDPQQDKTETPQPQPDPIWSSLTSYKPCYRLLSEEEMDAQLDTAVKLIIEWKVKMRQRVAIEKQKRLAEIQKEGFEKYQTDMQLYQMQLVREELAEKAKRNWQGNFERVTSVLKKTTTTEEYNHEMSVNDTVEYVELSSSDSDLNYTQ